MAKIFAVVFIALFFVTVECSVSKDCGSKKGKDVRVDISGCPDGMNPCKLPKGKNINVTIRFEALEAATKLSTVVHGIIHDIPIPFPMGHPNACKGCNITCPLVANKMYYFHSHIPVKASYPSLELKVKWELQDENGVDVVCLLIPAEVTSAAKEKRRRERQMRRKLPRVFHNDGVSFE